MRSLSNHNDQVIHEDFSSLGLKPSVESVAASEFRIAGDHRAWDVSWSSIAGKAIEGYNFSCTALNLTAAYTGAGICLTHLVKESVGGEPLSGSFTLTVTSDGFTAEQGVLWGRAEATVNLTYNATAAEVRGALEAINTPPALGVELMYSLPGGVGGSTYLLTFPRASGATSSRSGVLLGVSMPGLKGTGASVSVREVHPGSRWGGKFALSLGGVKGPALPFDADADEVREAVEYLILSISNKTMSLDVWKEDVQSGHRWAVVFSGDGLGGDIDTMKVRSGTAMFTGITTIYLQTCMVHGSDR